LIFRFKDIYELDISLPVEVNKDNSEAKFDRKRNVLSITAEIIRKHTELFKPKEDEDIEFVPHEEGKKDEPKKEETKTNEDIKITDNRVSEVLSKENDATAVDKNTTNIDSNDKLSTTRPEIVKEDNIKVNNIQRETLEIPSDTNAIQLRNKDNSITEIEISKNKIIELPSKGIVKTKKEEDEDDVDSSAVTVHNQQPQQSDKKDLNKVIFLNFNCDLIYEID
jgi:hypothetical protein